MQRPPSVREAFFIGGKMSNRRVTVLTLREMKGQGEKIAMLTAYDYPFASIVDEAGIEIILVGDSLGMVVLGYDSTIPVTLEDTIRHTQAVVRGTQKAMVIADMPFLTYQVSPSQALMNAGRLMQEAGAQGVKLEGGREVAQTVHTIVSAGIPVMGHLGLTPQSVHQLGGYKVQGRTEDAAKRLKEDALILQDAGAFSIVLEAVPLELAKEVTESLQIPTIGIGAGPHCDGQVLVLHDLLGVFQRFTPKFVKRYAEIGEMARKAIEQYRDEVKEGLFPAEEHSYK